MGLVHVMVTGSAGLAALDDDVARWSTGITDSVAVDVTTLVTHLGDTLVVLLALLVAGLIHYRRHGRAGVFVFLAVAIVGEKLIVNGLKEIVDRARPAGPYLTGWDGPAFPSGHAAAAAVAWPAIAIVLTIGCGWLVRAAAIGAAGVLAIAVGASRAVLGVHWFTDVIAGLAIGVGWCAVCAILVGADGAGPLSLGRRRSATVG